MLLALSEIPLQLFLVVSAACNLTIDSVVRNDVGVCSDFESTSRDHLGEEV